MSVKLKVYAIYLLVCVASLSTIGARAQEPEGDTEFTFGVVPQFEARELADIWVPLLQILEQETGYNFRMVGAPRITDFERAFEAGQFDFAYMNPYHSLSALREQGYRPLVRDNSQLFGVLVVKKDSQFTDIQSLHKSKIAFPAPNALGASLLMRADLDLLHGIEFKPVYAQTHTSSYLNVLLGETHAAGGVMGTFQQLKEEYRAELHVIYETRRMPTHPIVAHPRVPRSVIDSVQAAILKLADTGAGKGLLSRIPMPNPIVTDVEDYAELSEWGLDQYYVNPDY